MSDKCIVLDGVCTWCGRRDAYGEVATCSIARDSPKVRKEIQARKTEGEFECFWCCKTFKIKSRWHSLTKDHIIPIARGGKFVKNNIVDACWRCNNLKGSLMPNSFLFADGTPVAKDKIPVVVGKLWELGISMGI